MTQWSPYQEAVFAAVEQTSANLVVEALAGSGKTTTIIEICKRLQAQAGGSVLLCAFNRRIKDELVQRAPRGVDVQTCHALGFASLGEETRRLFALRDASSGFGVTDPRHFCNAPATPHVNEP